MRSAKSVSMKKTNSSIAFESQFKPLVFLS